MHGATSPSKGFHWQYYHDAHAYGETSRAAA